MLQNGKNIIALGFFDGLHIGHARLLNKMKQRAAELSVTPVMLTFNIHPETRISGSPPPLLNTLEDREFIARYFYGVTKVSVLNFTEDLMKMPWRSFITEVLVRDMRAAGLVAGWDFRFGYFGEGDAERLSAESARLGLTCDIIERTMLNGITVSSTYIRALIAEGNVAEAVRFLGHPHVVSGIVSEGSFTLSGNVQQIPPGRYSADLLSDISTTCSVKAELKNSRTVLIPDCPISDGQIIRLGLRRLL